jgi:hypothetical protein
VFCDKNSAMKKERIIGRCSAVAPPLFPWMALPPRELQTRARIAQRKYLISRLIPPIPGKFRGKKNKKCPLNLKWKHLPRPKPGYSLTIIPLKLIPGLQGTKNIKNYQTNPFVIFRFAHEYRRFSPSSQRDAQKRTHLYGAPPSRRPVFEHLQIIRLNPTESD